MQQLCRNFVGSRRGFLFQLSTRFFELLSGCYHNLKAISIKMVFFIVFSALFKAVLETLHSDLYQEGLWFFSSLFLLLFFLRDWEPEFTAANEFTISSKSAYKISTDLLFEFPCLHKKKFNFYFPIGDLSFIKKIELLTYLEELFVWIFKAAFSFVQEKLVLIVTHKLQWSDRPRWGMTINVLIIFIVWISLAI